MRSFFSFISVSVAAPTSITATPPASLARRSCSFSLSKSEVVSSICTRIWLIRFLISSAEPAPSTIIVSSLLILTCLARPNISTSTFFMSRPRSSETTWPPVKIAMSSSMALRRSPKPGALTATQVKVPRILFSTNVANASPSTSSATTSRGFPRCTIFSSRGSMSWILLILRSVSRIIGSSSTASIFSVSVTM